VKEEVGKIKIKKESLSRKGGGGGERTKKERREKDQKGEIEA
jgi:hypothetical protein